ncbi:MAG TPA: bifunctional DNA-formamidopyrimidine glycosylase/DNA-(apurinic or apyrimidinic site) lyase [Tepidisphaeraceae bacterium]|nr:bifunctional DNA-formamidopyrimidine glycosylase/DNA-(apurinic or apyrimidinic site) lyase [Tepidisphaeraceae bacterium]
MPELPEVQHVVDTLRPHVTGVRIRAVRLHRNDIVEPMGFDLSKALTDRSIQNVSRRAKRIVFSLDDGQSFYIHLGMSGRLIASEPNATVAKHTHLMIEIDRPVVSQIRFVDPRRFGGIFWTNDDTELGPEPLTISSSILARQLAGTKRIVKSALLDQKLIAGLGNIYVDESLFDARIHPERISSELSREEVGRLCRSIKSVLKRAINSGGSSLRDYVDANGERGGFQKLHRVYGRAGEKCVKCRSAITSKVLGGRTTAFCPRCQMK